MRTIFIVSLLAVPIILVVLRQPLEESTITTGDRIQNAGYSYESYDIYTEDGYGLTIFRVKNSTSTKAEGDSRSSTASPTAPVVLLMHGLSSSSDIWVIEGLSNPLVYDLVNQGYDVWLGNNRGNRYGNRHLNMTSNDRHFWSFSIHEIGTLDLPRIIDFILEHTQQPSLHYVGYSQGTTVGFIMLSMRPEYNHKLKSISMLSPCVIMIHGSSPTRHLARFLGIYTPIHSYIGDSALFRPWIIRKLLGFEMCRSKDANAKICSFIIFKLFGGYSAYLDESLLPDIFNTHPTTASAHQILHLMQFHHTKKFIQYNHGPEVNQKRYNQSTPPEYNLSNINPRFPIHLFYSGYDEYIAPKDIAMLGKIMGNRTREHFIDLENFSHIDFVWASNIKEVINRPLLDIINEAEMVLQTEGKSPLKFDRKQQL
ncbi:lipase 3 [Stomoxys calcitrans]|uniref:Lipase n=1 Tax=Stomoxys calcitrans TaxID=35570 RepID=A0A1I8Q0Z6_STOCA|nr:lipase 3 [Stomoxys calcitrans]